MSFLPTGFIRWLRLARNGHEARADQAVRAEAERAVDRRRSLAEATGIAKRPGGLLRLSAILSESMRITRLYNIWGSNIIKVEVLEPPEEERDEGRAASDKGRIVDARDDARGDETPRA
ncbi:hypothetical protein [Desulfocurvus sp. DL9XJH121]